MRQRRWQLPIDPFFFSAVSDPIHPSLKYRGGEQAKGVGLQTPYAAVL